MRIHIMIMQLFLTLFLNSQYLWACVIHVTFVDRFMSHYYIYSWQIMLEVMQVFLMWYANFIDISCQMAILYP